VHDHKIEWIAGLLASRMVVVLLGELGHKALPGAPRHYALLIKDRDQTLRSPHDQIQYILIVPVLEIGDGDAFLLIDVQFCLEDVVIEVLLQGLVG